MSSNALFYSFHLYSMQPKNKRWYNIYLVFTADNKSSIVAISINCFIINLMSYSKTIHVGITRFIFVCRFTYFTFHRFNEKLILVLTVEAIIKTNYLLFLWDTFFHLSNFAGRFQPPTTPFYSHTNLLVSYRLISTISLNFSSFVRHTNNSIRELFRCSLYSIIMCLYFSGTKDN